jgi:hypothetical protein
MGKNEEKIRIEEIEKLYPGITEIIEIIVTRAIDNHANQCDGCNGGD